MLYPIGLVVRARLLSGLEVEGQITKVETTSLGTYLHFEFGEQVANITHRQIIGYYDFCVVRRRRSQR